MLGSRGSSGSGDAGLRLGAFGKHPGWNDHLDDPGLDSQPLVNFKTLVYVEGVAAAIESGAWDKLEPGRRVDGFSHVIVMRTRGALLLARMWSSQDGKGRARYPMAVVAQVAGVPIEWALSTVLPELECVQARCEQAATQSQVLAVLESARASLRAKAQVASSDAEIVIPAGFVRAIADSPEMGPGRLGMHRVLYQIHRGVTDFELAGEVSKPPIRASRIEQLPSVHLRLPVVRGAGTDGASGDGGPPEGGGGRGAESILAALRLVLARVDAGLPVLVIARVGGQAKACAGGAGEGGGGGGERSGVFVDVILGEPQGAQIQCLQADEKAIPLTTAVPYTIEPGFAAQADRWVDAFASKGDRRVPASEGARRKLGIGRFMSIALAAVTLAGAAGSARAQGEPPASPMQAEPRQRYNDALTALHFQLIDPRTTDAQAEQATRAFMQDVQGLPGGVAYLAQVKRLLASMEEVLQGKPGAAAVAEAAGFGPSSIGGYEAVAEGQVVRFRPTIDPALPTLTFARLDLPNGRVAYIGTTEVSFDQFNAMVSRRSGAAELSKVLKTFDRVSDPRRGPRVWEWADGKGGGAIRPAREWLARIALGSRSDYPPDGVPPPPGPDMPMQYLSPSAALYAARLVGCRLPTPAEWNLARSKYAAAVQPGETNLRDRTWRQQFEYVRSIIESGSKAQSPEQGAFVPPGTDPKAPRDRAVDASDGTLWFTPVTVGAGEVVHNLVGNVAEYVVNDAGTLPAQKFAAVGQYLQEHTKDVGVIGGSALSDPAIDPTTPQPLDLAEAEEGYADVGFRLAFSAGMQRNQSLAARLEALIDPLPVLSTRPGAPAQR